MNIRPAREDDLAGIMNVERQEFGVLGEKAMASEDIMESRIVRCNSGVECWFWVAEESEVVVGYIALQPTHLRPEECTSWDAATDNGTLSATFKEDGENVYIVSLAVLQSAPAGTAELLGHIACVQWAATRKKHLIFCSRMPGFAKYADRGMSAEIYWKRKRPDSSPADPMIHIFWRMAGEVWPVKLLKDGFPPDALSRGHGVLFVLRNAGPALRATALDAYRATRSAS